MKLPILQKINHHCCHFLSFSSSGPSTKLVTSCHWYVREKDGVDGQLEKKKTNQTKLKFQLLFLLLLNKPTLQRFGLILASVSCPAIKDWFQKFFLLQIFPRICDDETEAWTLQFSYISHPLSTMQNMRNTLFLECTENYIQGQNYHIQFPGSFYIGHLYNIFILYSYYIHIIYHIYS